MGRVLVILEQNDSERVPTNLESPGKPGKMKWSENFYCFSKKSGKVETLF